MKAKLLSSLLFLYTPFAFAEGDGSSEEQKKPKPMFYVQMGVDDSISFQHPQVNPSLGVGCRIHEGKSALDISTHYSGRVWNDSTTYFYTLPKLNYLRYLKDPDQPSAYYGGGLSFGGLHNKEESRFFGMIVNAAVGYETNRFANWRGFVQADLYQPIIPISGSKGPFPGPFAELGVGGGF